MESVVVRTTGRGDGCSQAAARPRLRVTRMRVKIRPPRLLALPAGVGFLVRVTVIFTYAVASVGRGCLRAKVQVRLHRPTSAAALVLSAERRQASLAQDYRDRCSRVMSRRALLRVLGGHPHATVTVIELPGSVAVPPPSRPTCWPVSLLLWRRCRLAAEAGRPQVTALWRWALPWCSPLRRPAL